MRREGDGALSRGVPTHTGWFFSPPFLCESFHPLRPQRHVTSSGAPSPTSVLKFPLPTRLPTRLLTSRSTSFVFRSRRVPRRGSRPHHPPRVRSRTSRRHPRLDLSHFWFLGSVESTHSVFLGVLGVTSTPSLPVTIPVLPLFEAPLGRHP